MHQFAFAEIRDQKINWTKRGLTSRKERIFRWIIWENLKINCYTSGHGGKMVSRFGAFCDHWRKP